MCHNFVVSVAELMTQYLILNYQKNQNRSTRRGEHVNGNAADIVYYNKSRKIISSKKVCCVAQDIVFGSIANIDGTYTTTHIDVHTSNFWKGDKVKNLGMVDFVILRAGYGGETSRLTSSLNTITTNINVLISLVEMTEDHQY